MSDFDKMSQHQVLGAIASAIQNTDAADGIALALGSIAHNLTTGNGLTNAVTDLTDEIHAAGEKIADAINEIAKAIRERNS